MMQEDRQFGAVDGSTYWDYLTGNGVAGTIVLLILFCVATVGKVASGKSNPKEYL